MVESEASEAWRWMASNERVSKAAVSYLVAVRRFHTSREDKEALRMALREAVILHEANTWHAPVSGAGGG